MPVQPTAIITGAAGGIGSGLIEGFLEEGYRVVATSLNTGRSLIASPSLVLVDGDLGKPEIAAKVADAAIQRFGTIDVLVNNAGIFRSKAFTDFTADDFDALAPGPVETPMHKDDPKEAYTDKQALKTVTQVKDIVDAVLYLARANQVTGEILYVDGGSHAGR